MRVLWMINTILPQIAEKIGRKEKYYLGWLSSLFDDVLKIEDIELGVCFPDRGKELVTGKDNNLTFYGLPSWCGGEIYHEKTTEYMKRIVDDFKPDILQVFGTEYPHSLSMVQAFHRPERTLVHIQGLISECAKEYCAGLPRNICKRYTLRDWIKRDNLLQQQKKFEERGVWEKETLTLVGHVLGRTDWDYESTKKINPNLQYHFLGEGLRNSFYEHTWKLTECKRHIIFASQALYPLKGIHFLLEAIGRLQYKYDDIQLYVTGKNKVFGTSFYEKMKVSSYNLYLHSLIRKYHLEDKVFFLGPMGEEDMCKQYLKSHIFVSPSSIENSSNSVGEAMLLGMPVVCSLVGGTSSILKNNVEGILYTPYTDVEALEKSIEEVFENDEKASLLGKNARKRALETYDRSVILKNLLSIYEEIIKSGEV